MSAMPKLMPTRPTRPELPDPVPAAPVAPISPVGPPTVYGGDRIALLFWTACALLIATLLVKDLFFALFGFAAR